VKLSRVALPITLPTTDFFSSPVTRHSPLISQVLVHPGADAIERLLDVFDRVGDAEAQIAFAEIAKRGPGQRGDAGIVE
jgi:hypothetical protein